MANSLRNRYMQRRSILGYMTPNIFVSMASRSFFEGSPSPGFKHMGTWITEK